MSRFIWTRFLPALPALVLLACGGSPASVSDAPVPRAPQAAVTVVTDENVYEKERALWRMAPDDPARLALRDALITYHGAESAEILARGNYSDAIRQLAELVRFLTPADLEAGRVPQALEPLARRVAERAQQQNEPGHAMGALYLLAAADPAARATHVAARERLANEAALPSDGEPADADRLVTLMRIWEEHERIAPTSEAIATLTRIFALLPDNFSDEARRTLLTVALHLRNADLGRAAEAAQAWRSLEGVDEELLEIVGHLERAQQDDGAGAEALAELVTLTKDLLGQNDDKARLKRLCRLGVRRFPASAAFPRCLAQVADSEIDMGRTADWYSEAIRLAPTDEELALEAVDRLKSVQNWERMLPTRREQSLSTTRQALEITEHLFQRWPEHSSPEAMTAVLSSFAVLEISSGNLAAARERLNASLTARENVAAHHLLGVLLDRTGQSREAAEHYRRALELSAQDGTPQERAALLQYLGDVHRRSGEAEQAEERYRQALEVWNERVESNRETDANALVRRGILKSRLGEREAAESDFSAALTTQPSSHDLYAQILGHLVVANPNPELAQSVLERAQQQVTSEWKVYLAMRAQVLAARAGAEPSPLVTSLLREIRGDSWAARLASFGLGQLDYEALLAAASTPNERAQAQFYQGARLLGSDDAEGARALFRQVLESGLLLIDEHLLALELSAGRGS